MPLRPTPSGLTPSGPMQPPLGPAGPPRQMPPAARQMPSNGGPPGGSNAPTRPPQSGAAAPSSAVQSSSAATSSAAGGPKQTLGGSVTVPEGPFGFIASRDEQWRPCEPTSVVESRINETILEAIIYRFLISMGECEGRKIADQVKLPFRMVEPLLERLKMEQNVAYKSSTATNDYVYILTESGRAIARNHLNDSTYYGACPVQLKDYINSVRYQTIEGQYPKKADLVRAFSDLLINPMMLNRLGPAVASGRGMFLFGFPGNGKTSIAERVTGAFGKYIWIPRAVDIDGDVMRVFDPMNHEMDMPESAGGLLDIGGYDKRWVRIKRPTIIAGGELTMDMLEVQCNSDSNISEAPLQLKSNCGTLVIDDFGRQRMRVDELLNRWIIPLEKRYDFLNMSSGKKIQVPFDQLVIFSTNLEPKDLVDDAFLRRIPYKIEVENPPEKDFRKLFEIMCKVVKIPYDAECVDYLIKTHYLPVNRPFRNCQPRDLLLQVRNYCMYNDLKVELKNEYFDFACDNYFSVM
ncbi:ATP-binding protein [Stieleria varia]|nr:AAA family ATPase [Stieleria varia]